MSIFGPLLLASKSPRRLKLLTEAGFDVEVIGTGDVKEEYPADLPVNEIPAFLSRLKAEACLRNSETLSKPLVAADTIVIIDRQPIGKPHSHSEAFEMLKRLSGRTHTVVSGVTLVKPDGDKITFSEETKVTFGRLSDTFIEYYLATYKPYDKAGSYGIQEWIGLVGIEGIEGDYYNIMGFPVHTFVQRFLAMK